MDSSAEALTPVVENGGFTIVEQDDVAFALSLCKEIHRIYGSYQSGELEAGDDSVRLGLLLTSQMLSTLGGAVTKGMPAMRLEVAAAQTREMVAVLFGEPISTAKRNAGRPRVERRCQRGVGMSSAGAEVVGNGGEMAIAALSEQHKTGVRPEIDVPATVPAGSNGWQPPPLGGQSSSTLPPGVPLLERWRSLFARWPLAIRVLLGLVGCGLAAVLTDAPIVLLLLFSNLLLPLGISFLSVAILGPRVYRAYLSPGRRQPQASSAS
jgi:hypothetical protein